MHRHDPKPGRGGGFSGELSPRSPSAGMPTVSFAVYPDPGGIARLQLVLFRSPGARPGAALEQPEPESIVRLVRALEQRTAATQ